MEIRDIPEPTAGPGDVKIEVKAAGICGSDIHIYHSDIAIPVNPPVVVGHEFSGVISEVGEGVTDWNVGDRVVSETAYSFCGRCEPCTNGFYNLCNERKTLGYWYDGIFANYTVIPAIKLHKLPDNLNFIEGALMEPFACVTHAVVELTRIIAGDVVLISGPGAIGLLALQVAKAQGAAVIMAGTSQDRERLQFAESLGADVCVDITQEDLLEKVAAMTHGQGADVVLECSGNPHATNSGLLAIKKRGYFTQIGLPGKPAMIDFEKICYKELHVTGSLGSRRDSWKKALQLSAQGKVRLAPLASHVLPLDEWQKAFDIFEKKEGLKLVLTPIES